MAKRKRKKLPRLLFIYTLCLCIAAAGFYYLNSGRSGNFILYKEFGIHMPVNYSVHGIDVSRYQSRIDWKNVKEMTVDDIKISFAFIKATEGLKIVDKQFHRNWSQSAKHGIPRGAYHFFIPGKSGIAQAKHFISEVKLKSGDLPPVLDVEVAYGASVKQVRTGVSEWLMVVENKYGIKPIIYTSVDFYKNYLDGYFDSYPLWIAHYKERIKPRIERDWIVWQHSESGSVNGIRGMVDFNVFNGDSIAFKKLLIKD